ncbi:Glycosyltransferase [Heracleum sosnowskyi]|uniref:Glycosyltransferase n=1 Tax=Heracleum sosnowskyi TaxID=360622 RepID=A0AAD8H3G8_9APIA|nr:Glycosyltransferase [Heracleum sosnowskyi]
MGHVLHSGFSSTTHVVLFPFMSKGHTIPLLQLARLILARAATVTIFTTPANLPFISTRLQNTAASIITLPFPKNIEGVPDGVESTDKLPSMSLFVPFVTCTKLMKPHFEDALEGLADVTFMITDSFLGWTLDSASKFGIPRLATYGFNAFSGAIMRSVVASRVLFQVESDAELFQVPDFPWIKVTRNDFSSPFIDREPEGPHFEFVKESITATSNSYGLLVNSFYELEPKFIEYSNCKSKPKTWSIGPLCLAEPPKTTTTSQKPLYLKWLDDKLENGKSSVLYVAFGSQAEISKEQLHEIMTGLEKSGVNFLWVVGKNGKEVDNEFERRVKDRGLVVRDWVDQIEILKHESVKGFLSHCGWNSALESICAKVPILGWPMMAEQPLNVRMVVEEIKVGLRVETCDGTVRGFVKWEGLSKMVKELMEGEMGKVVRKNVEEIGDAAAKAVLEESGSSWKYLDHLIEDIVAFRNKKFVSQQA